MRRLPSGTGGSETLDAASGVPAALAFAGLLGRSPPRWCVPDASGARAHGKRRGPWSASGHRVRRLVRQAAPLPVTIDDSAAACVTPIAGTSLRTTRPVRERRTKRVFALGLLPAIRLSR